MRLHPQPRRGVSIAEFAIVSSVMVLIVAALLSGCLGIFRYQQVAALSRELARYASVHSAGTPDGRLAGNPLSDHQSVISKSNLLNASNLSWTITYSNTPPQGQPKLYYSDNTATTLNVVTVTVTYHWQPEIFFGGSYTLQSTSQKIVTY
jgi:hypothetical protein